MTKNENFSLSTKIDTYYNRLYSTWDVEVEIRDNEFVILHGWGESTCLDFSVEEFLAEVENEDDLIRILDEYFPCRVEKHDPSKTPFEFVEEVCSQKYRRKYRCKGCGVIIWTDKKPDSCPNCMYNNT